MSVAVVVMETINFGHAASWNVSVTLQEQCAALNSCMFFITQTLAIFWTIVSVEERTDS